MSETPTHTPGPWTAVNRPYTSALDGTPQDDWCVEANGEEILALYWGNGADEPEQFPMKANAHLIAAAPDMKAALEFIRDNSGDPVMEACANAVIAKAEGRDVRVELPPEIAPPAQGTAWQPIETAPKDGTPVLVRGRRTHTVNTATCRPDYHATRPWCDWDGRDPLPSGDEPTHWMPMPPPPTEADYGKK